MKQLSLPLIFTVLLMSSGCASYRTNSDVTFKSTEVNDESQKKEIQILETSLEEGSYEALGSVNGIVKKLTIFHKDPTKEQVNIVLIDKASKLDADAVINVKYKSGIGATTWGFMKGSGEAVKIKDK